ncbi:sensor histidine kinase [Caenimonas terrae]|uniref:histidine kinase n=1 Tax=Caenimonas terrae TaxID=696074 RepID=A0ABW0ND51_9BURK
MKPDTSPAIGTQEEARWVEDELVRSLVRTARSWQYLGLLMAVVVVGLLWDDAPHWLLATWTISTVLVSAARIRLLQCYARLPAAQQAQFFAQWRFLWPLSAFVGGLATGLFFDRAPLADQFICWLFMAGMAMFSINSLASHLATMRGYLNALALTALASMLWRIGVELRFGGPFYHYWVMGLLVVFWVALLQAGRRLHMTHRTNFELQYRNIQLIDTLTAQTQAALDAVAIKNRFLASAAHDIRQPVHALGLYADWLRSEPDLVGEIAPKIVESTKAVNALFDSLFDLARLDSGKIRLRLEPVDLPKLLHDLELQYRPLAQARGLSLRMHLAPGTALSDPILLQRIVGNLIANALKYTEQGGVLVASRSSQAACRIEIWDTGVGIAPAYQRDIFREFYKVPSHRGTEEGFGLGLSIVQRLTHILGHPLTLASRPGRGSVFRLLLLPTDAGEAARRAAATVAQLVNMP